jgi:8-oxo-dGTP diphosphatase
MTQNLKISIRSEILQIVGSIQPFDHKEKEHITYTQQWITSGVEIFRIAKPATPNIHLVSYFVLIDENTDKVLLVDHKKSGLWLPPGGHVEPNEHPKETVKREILEELAISADFLHYEPVFLTVTKTVGQTAGHTDVSFWYLLRGDSAISLKYDQKEFNGIHWFDVHSIPYENTDPPYEKTYTKINLS